MKGIAGPFRIDLSFNPSVVKTRFQTGKLQKMFGKQLIFKQTSKIDPDERKNNADHVK